MDKKLNNNSKNIILLIDDTLLLDSVDLFASSQTIISLDFLSHEKLKLKKIKHIESDIFISETEIKNLQEHSNNFTHWYEDLDIKNCTTYKNINLGELFYVDFYVYLIPVLKTFFELSKIISKYPDSYFIASSNISKFIEQFSVQFKEIKQINVNPNFYLDSINYQIKLNKKSFQIPISKSNYRFMKKISESFFKYLFKQNYDNLKKSHILVEFDPLRFRELFSILPKTSNFIVYNRRRPYFWNLQSFLIFKKSEVSFFTENELIDSEIQNNIKNLLNWSSNALLKLKTHDKYFNNYFKINDKSFWNIIEKSFFSLCKTRFEELVCEIEYAHKLFEKTNPSTLTVWSELGSYEQILINIAKSKKIPVILLQHGYYRDDKSATIFNYFSGVLPKKSDYFLVWGNKMIDYCKGIGLELNKIKIIGSPFFDNYNNLHKLSSKSDYVLLAAQGPTDFSILDLKNNAFANYIETIIQICKITKKMKKNLIIKLHPDPHDLDITKYIEPLNLGVQVIKSGNIAELIQDCELFLSIDISTTILEAELLQKPVISISVKDFKLGYSNSQIFQSSIYVAVNELENERFKVLNDKKYRNKIISNGTKFVNEYLSNQNSSSKSFINFLDTF